MVYKYHNDSIIFMGKRFTKSEKEHLSKIGKNIREVRSDRNLSQESLASLAGLDRTYIGGVERGERNISVLNITKIAKALNVSINQLFKDF